MAKGDKKPVPKPKPKPKPKPSKKPADAPKQRTRSHVIASLSTNHVERLIYEKGYSAERVENDYGFDLLLQTFDASGYVEAGFIFLQLKATDALTLIKSGKFVSFSVTVSDYKSWCEEAYPVFLVVYDAAKNSAYWIYVQRYFDEDDNRRPGGKATEFKVHIPVENVLDGSTIDFMRKCKQERMKEYSKVKHA